MQGTRRSDAAYAAVNPIITEQYVTFRTRTSTMEMERLFSPCNRLHALIESQDNFVALVRDDLRFTEELNLNVSSEDFLSTERAFTYVDLYGMLTNEYTVAWLTPHAMVALDGFRSGYNWEILTESACRFCFSVDGKDIMAFALSPNIYWRFAMLFFDCWQ
jgi:hypothetical protein